MPEKRIYATLGSFALGLNSGVDPLLLPSNQLAFASNGTNRGDYYKQRPNYKTLTLVGSADDLSAFQISTALFQAACYYRNNSSAIMVMVGGRLFSLSPGVDTATVVQIPLPDSLFGNVAKQNWMWQAESWLIVQDGLVAPLTWSNSAGAIRTSPEAVVLATASGNELNTTPNTLPVIHPPGVPFSVDVSPNWPNTQTTPVILIDASGNVIGQFSADPAPSGDFNAVLKNDTGTIQTVPNGSALFVYTPPPGDFNAVITNNTQSPIVLNAGAVLQTYTGSQPHSQTKNVNIPASSLSVRNYGVINVAFGLGSITFDDGFVQSVSVVNGDTVNWQARYNNGNSGTGFGNANGGWNNDSRYVNGVAWNPSDFAPFGFPNFDYYVQNAYVIKSATHQWTSNPTWTTVATIATGVTIAAGATANVKLTAAWNGADTNVVAQSQTPPATSMTLKKYTAVPEGWSKVADVITGATIQVGATAFVKLNPAWLGADTDVVWDDSTHSHNPIPPTNKLTVSIYSSQSTDLSPKVVLTNVTATYSVNGTAVSIQPGTKIYSLPGLPIGTIGVYGMGRNWVALPDGKSFVASDIVGSSSGTLANNYKDAVLYITQNNDLAGGGTFSLPNAGEKISAMKFTASLDASLGQGFLQVFTNQTVFSCNAGTDITQWATMTSPILTESLIGAGAASQDSVSQENADIIFRSSDGGVRSLLMARLDFNRWGNTPISREVVRSLSNDNLELLPYARALHFNNRRFELCQPTQSGRGVTHAALVSLNFDAISTLANKQPSVWESEWTVPNALALVGGFFNGVERAFMLCLNDGLIELREVLPDTAATKDDAGTSVTWMLESPVLFQNPNHDYKRLVDGELYFRDITEDMTAVVSYKADQNSQWTPWYAAPIKFKANDSTYRPRVGLGQPPANVFDSTNNKPLREGYAFQIKVELSGACTFIGARFAADIIPQPEFAQPGKT